MQFSPTFKTALEATLTALQAANLALPKLINERVTLSRIDVSPSELRRASERLMGISDLIANLEDSAAELSKLISQI